MIHRIGRTQAGILAAIVSLCTVAAMVLAHPAVAEAPGPNVPDAGARPPAAAGTTVTTPTQNVPAGLSPAAQQLQAETFAVQALAEQLKKLDEQVAQAQTDTLARQNEMEAAQRRLSEAKESAESAAADAYKASRALGPLGGYSSDLNRLSRVMPAIGPRPGGPGSARELARAEAAASAATNAYRDAQIKQSSVLGLRDAAKIEYDTRAAKLAAMSADPATNAALEAEIDAYESSIGVGFDLGANTDGLAPNPKVAQVLEHARRQLGKPYVFGAEGPNAYDCSGLVWDSYRQVGKYLPRIANEQYRDTPKLPAGAGLLAGDLVFFGPSGSWTGIHHVGIYIGGGKMIQAPTTGQRVKISPVWKSRFYGATRPLPAVAETPPPVNPPPVNPPPSEPSSSPPSSSPPSSSSSSPPPSSEPPPSSTPPSTPPSSSPSAPSQSPSGGSAGSTTPSATPSSSRPSSRPAAPPPRSSSSPGGSGSSGP
jgi:cell wall-associated NlpC family hydrolase